MRADGAARAVEPVDGEPVDGASAAASGVFATLELTGMSCASCAARVERAVRLSPQVSEAHVNFARSTLVVRLSHATDSLSEVQALVQGLGFGATPASPTSQPETLENRELVALQVRLAVAVFFGMTAMLPTIVVYLGAVEPADVRALWWLALVSGVLTLPVIFFSGWPFLVRAWKSILQRAPGMDLLVASGALAAFLHSTVALARGSSDVFFDTSAAIVTFLLIGRLLESFARRRSLSAVRLLHALSPAVARVLADDGLSRDVDTESVVRGARVVVRPGARIPLDGRVVSGSSYVDRSLLTGESMPVAVTRGDTVEAGTLNQLGVLVLEVTEPVGSRALDRIASSVDHLLARRAPMQALADRVAAKLTVGVLLLAASVAVGWDLVTGDVGQAVMRAVAVLVIACPCALGLATPMAVLVAAGAAARRGILFRDAATIERAAEVSAVLVDKTGTLTEGRPTVVDVIAADSLSREEVLTIAAIAERESEHPIARAILSCAAGGEGAADKRVDGATQASSLGGVVFYGIDGRVIRVGTRELLEGGGVRAVPEPEAHGTIAHVAVDALWVGLIVVSDPVREGAARAVEALGERGLRVALVTGDRPSVAKEVAEAVHIDEVHAGCSPEDKAKIVSAAQERGDVVAFVGDGLNDGPALAAADLGVAVEGATDVASAAAGVTLRAGGIERLREALDLARATRRVMRQNIAWAFAYNALAIPAAILGFVTPSVAAIAMATSSLSVIANSLRLGRHSRGPLEIRLEAREQTSQSR